MLLYHISFSSQRNKSYLLIQTGWKPRGSILHYKLGHYTDSISHLFYADEMLLFTNGSISSIQRLKLYLMVYERSSRQKINFEKSGFYPSRLIQGIQLHRLGRKHGCVARKLPFVLEHRCLRGVAKLFISISKIRYPS